MKNKFKYKCKYVFKNIFLLLIITNLLITNLITNLCQQCINKAYKKCEYCSREIIFNGLQIASREETLDEIIINNKSIARFGDGEFMIMFGKRIGFQKVNKLIKTKLLNILNSNLNNLLIGINVPFHEYELKLRNKFSENYWKHWFDLYKFSLAKILNKHRKYYSALITRFYSVFQNKKKFPILKYIKRLKKIWDKKDVLIIEGYYSRIGIGNDLFNNTKSIKRIICPPTNAFQVYTKIINEVKQFKIDNNFLILIALGPTASILAYDLSKLGFQAIDIGHADIEYELYLRKYDNIKRIPYKYVNDAVDGHKHIEKIKDKRYYSQIIKKIMQ